MPRRRKLVIDTLRGAPVHLFGYWTEDDAELFAFLIQKFGDAELKKNWDTMIEAVKIGERSDDTMQEEERQEETQEQRPVLTMPLDMQVSFLMSTTYKHLTKIAMLLDLLRQIYPDLQADFGKALDEWLYELNEDCKAGYGFSLLEEEEPTPKQQ